MPDLLVIFDSKTGYTENMAKTIVEGAKSIEGINVILEKVDSSTSTSILRTADAVAIGSPSHNGYITLEIMVFLANINQAIASGSLDCGKKFGLAFGSYSWDNGICIENLHEEMKKLGFNMDKKVIAHINPIPDNSTEDQFCKECYEAGKKLAEKTLAI
ncbi:MAG: flavodoxin domain-containing protein [Candidatus Bathyarchaeota archaeon]